MRYLSVCSGIEAATVAWHPLGWTPVGFSEIEAFPSAVLAHHYPNIPNYGDMTQHEQWPIERGAVDLLVGGTPCQSFSVAGLRKGLKDPRGGLMLTYLEIAQRLRPRWVVWENVPGVLSSNGGRDFGSFLGALGELGYGWAYRVLDAQWCRTHRHPRAVPQRRRRVFVVGRLIERGAGDWTAAAAICFESQSVRRHNPARRASVKGAPSDAEGGAGAGGEVAGTIAARFGQSRNNHEECVAQPVAGTLGTRGVKSYTELDGHGAYIAVPYDLYQITAPINRQNRQPGDPCHTLARDNAAHAAIACVNMQGSKSNACVSEDGTAYSLNAMHGHDVHAVAFQQNTRDEVRLMNGDGAIAGALSAEAGMKQQNYVAAIQGNLVGRDAGGPHGVGASEEGTMYTLTKADTHAVAHAAVAFTAGNLVRGAGSSPNVEVSQTLQSQHGRGSTDQHPCVAHAAVATSFIPGNSAASRSLGETVECSVTVKGEGGGTKPHVQYGMTVRRLTPVECERLQGFPDNYTAIPWRKKGADECPDGPRYKALGNSMAVNCMEWIGERIAAQEAG